MDWEEIIERIPEPLTTRYIFDGDEYRGHSTYTGHGSGKDGDYWDCYCLRDGCKPPTEFKEFLKHVNNPEQVLEWKAKYGFTLIVCFCWCCHGADPVVMYGWPIKGYSGAWWKVGPFEPSENESDDEEEHQPPEEPERWTARSSRHAFWITEYDKLVYHGEVRVLKS